VPSSDGPRGEKRGGVWPSTTLPDANTPLRVSCQKRSVALLLCGRASDEAVLPKWKCDGRRTYDNRSLAATHGFTKSSHKNGTLRQAKPFPSDRFYTKSVILLVVRQAESGDPGLTSSPKSQAPGMLT